MRKQFSKLMERVLIRCADEVIVVTDSIGQWYRGAYSIDRVTVVKNTPLRLRHFPGRNSALKERLGVPARAQLYIYQGNLGHDRGIEILLNVFSQGLDDKHIVFVGFGPLAGEVKRNASERKNIHFHDAVPPHELGSITSGADVGIALLENTSLNHYYCLGNKVFEYLQHGLPIIVSDFPEMSGVVSRHGCGWSANIDSAAAIAQTIAEISWDDIYQKTRRAESCRDVYVWENEEPELIEVYRRLATA